VATTQFELVTPTRNLYSGEAEMVVCRTVEGEIAFLADHMPYIGALDPCLLRVVGPEAGEGDEVRVAVRSGFVEVKGNQVIMLAELALLGSEVNPEEARRDEAEASQRVTDAAGDDEASRVANADLRWAQARIEAAELPAHS
jgi:F-type H+-transporting ATPase subunit epsilon